MTRAEVIDRLGRPHEQNPRWLAYGPPRREAEVSFDVYLDTASGRPVRMIGFWGKRFVLPDGTSPFRRGGVRRLKKLYGSRLKKHHQRRLGIRLYRLKTRYLGRRVWTEFQVDRFEPSAPVRAISILFRPTA